LLWRLCAQTFRHALRLGAGIRLFASCTHEAPANILPARFSRQASRVQGYFNLSRLPARKIPIIALTANAFDEDVQRSLQAGMNAHLTKPVESEHLYETLEQLIKD
jgi:PleD family two-component response regulator